MKKKGVAKVAVKKKAAAKPVKRVAKKPTVAKNAPKALPKPIDVMSRKLNKPAAGSALANAIAEKMKQRKGK